MTIQKLQELISTPESEKLDFKLVFNLDREHNKKEFVKDVTAIANARGGRGYLVFGIEDKTKEVVGVLPKKYDEERVQQLICGRCDPPVPVRLEEIEYLGKIILVLTIFKSYNRPHQVLQTGTFYIRRGSTTDIARRSEIAGMLQESGTLNYETTLVFSAGLEQLDLKSIEPYLGKQILYKTDKNLLILESMGIIGKNPETDKYCVTAGGLLLFGKNPQTFMPSSGIKIVHGKNIYNIEGNIPMLINKAEKIVKNIFKDTNYPIQAIFEAIYNAVVHRDYWDNTRETVVMIDKKGVEIINPGAVWAKEGNMRIGSDSNPSRRNSWLYQRLLILDKKQRFLNNFVGIRNISESFADCSSTVKFVNLPKKNLFKVVLPGIEEI